MQKELNFDKINLRSNILKRKKVISIKHNMNVKEEIFGETEEYLKRK